MKRKKIDGRLLPSKNKKPEGELRKRLIRQGFDPDRFLVTDMPSFLVFSLDSENKLLQHACMVDTYEINSIIKKELYFGTTYVFDSQDDNIIRFCNIIGGKDYISWLREQKLERILNGD